MSLKNRFSDLYIPGGFTLSVCRDGVILSLSKVETTLRYWDVKDSSSLVEVAKAITSFLKHHKEHRFHSLAKNFSKINSENSENVFKNMEYITKNGLFGKTKYFPGYEGNFTGENVIPDGGFSKWFEDTATFQKEFAVMAIEKASQAIEASAVSNKKTIELKKRENKPLLSQKIAVSVKNWFYQMRWALTFLVIEIGIFIWFIKTDSEVAARFGIFFGIFAMCYCLIKATEAILYNMMLKYQEKDKKEEDDE